MKTAGIVIILFSGSVLYGQEINFQLKTRLDSLQYKDQALRELTLPNATDTLKIKTLNLFGIDLNDFKNDSWKYIIAQDSLNLTEIKSIIRTYGYPGKSLVGEPANKTAWYIIQHSNEIPAYFPIIKAAGSANEIPYTLVAAMKDRILMYEGKEQNYGTQASSRQIMERKRIKLRRFNLSGQ